MARLTEFADILIRKIQSEKAMESGAMHAEFDPEPAHLSYLLGRLERPYSRPFRAEGLPNAYAKWAPTPVAHCLTEMQKKALSQWETWGLQLSPGFRQMELKRGFRFLAKRLHPDLSGRSGAEFIALRESYKELSKLFA